MGTQLIVWISLVTSLGTPCASETYYNEQRIETYTRLSQQLRSEVSEELFHLLSRATLMEPIPRLMKNALARNIKFMRKQFINYEKDLTAVAKLAKIRPVQAMTLRTSRDYRTDTIFQLPFDYVETARGIVYDNNSGEIFITKSGWYLLELQYREQPVTYNFKVKIEVKKPSGSPRYSMVYTFERDEPPIIEALKLRAGDKIITFRHKHSGNNNFPAVNGTRLRLTQGMWNQLNFRFIGLVN